MSYEQFFDDEDLKPMWGALAVKLFILKCNGYRESAKDRKALDILLHDMMKLCKSMELTAGLDDQKRKHPESAGINPQMALLKNEAMVKVHNGMDEKVKSNLPLLEWAVNHLPAKLLQEFGTFVESVPQIKEPTAYDNLMSLESVLKEMDRLFKKAAEEENLSLTKNSMTDG